MQITIKSLRQSGVKVMVNHKRRYKFFDLIEKKFVYFTFCRFDFVNFLKGENKVRYLVVDRMQTGGETEIIMTGPGGEESIGVAKVSNKDNYNKKRGIELALKRAIKNIGVAKFVESLKGN